MSLTDMVIMPGADYQAACDAIREKTEGVGYIRSGDMAELIRSIETGTQLPELTKPASANDIAYGFEAINENGEIVKGAVFEAKGGYTVDIDNEDWGRDDYTPITLEYKSGKVRMKYLEDPEGTGYLFRPNATLRCELPGADLGDATAEDVAAGKTFTSTAGLKVTGTAKSGSKTVSVTIDSAAMQYGYDIYAQYVGTNGETTYQVIPAKTTGTAMAVPVLSGMIVAFMGASTAAMFGYDGTSPKEATCIFPMVAGNMPAKILYPTGNVILKPLPF